MVFRWLKRWFTPAPEPGPHFLFQINYAEMPHIPGYPDSGLLSVFVQDEDIFCCGFPSVDQKGFRSMYYSDPITRMSVDGCVDSAAG